MDMYVDWRADFRSWAGIMVVVKYSGRQTEVMTHDKNQKLNVIPAKISSLERIIYETKDMARLG